jgi:hypothetical protein
MRKNLSEEKRIQHSCVILNTLEFNRGFYIDTSRSIFEYFKIHKKCQIVLLKACKVKPDGKILSEGKIVQFALT